MTNQIPISTSIKSTVHDGLLFIFTALMSIGLILNLEGLIKSINNGKTGLKDFFSLTGLSYFVFSAIIILFIFSFINYFFTGRQFDKKFRVLLLTNPLAKAIVPNAQFFNGVMIWCRFSRAIIYTKCIYRPKKNSKSYYPLFKGYDFRKNARIGSLISSYMIIYYTYAIFFLIILYTTVTLLFYIAALL